MTESNWNRMKADLAGHLRSASSSQKWLYGLGLLMIASGLFHLAVFFAASGSWAGDVSWRKPIIFGLSGGLTCWSLAWISRYLPSTRASNALHHLVAWSLLFEIVLITMQQWRGVRSHFNLDTAFDAGVFNAMGALIILVEIALGVFTWWSFRRLEAAASVKLAVRVGMVALMVSMLWGNLIIANGNYHILNESGHAPNIFRDAGAMKVPHGLSLHGVQLLPLLAWALGFASIDERARTRLVALTSAGYVTLIALQSAQAAMGRGPADLGLWQVAAHFGAAALIAGPHVWAGAALTLRPAERQRSHTHA